MGRLARKKDGHLPPQFRDGLVIREKTTPLFQGLVKDSSFFPFGCFRDMVVSS
jgi:hypothetical protein